MTEVRMDKCFALQEVLKRTDLTRYTRSNIWLRAREIILQVLGGKRDLLFLSCCLIEIIAPIPQGDDLHFDVHNWFFIMLIC